MATQHARVARWQGDLLPHMVDRLARETPDAVYGLWPVAPASYDAGFRTITYAQLANVINGLAWWLVERLGPGQNQEVLTYVGPNDVRLAALVVASIKAGYALFLTSPRNSPAAHQSLFATLKCTTLLTTAPTPPPALAVIEAVKPRQLTIPSVDDLVTKPYPLYVYKKTYEEGRLDPLWIIHTSGSTGIPKPLVWTQEAGARHHNCSAREPPKDVPSLERAYHGKRVMVTTPPFHGAGLAQYLFNAIPFGNITIAPAAAAIATAQGLVDALKQTPAEMAILVPSVVAELAQSPQLLEYCASHLEMILYIGGDLPQAIGDKVAEKVRLRCLWGSSETGIPQQLLPTELGPLDWRYIRFHPCAGAVFEKVADGNYELVIRRDEALADTQAAFAVRGQDKLEKEYRTRDLFEPHPTVPDAWCWRARADDIIVFLNGEKTNPVSMEQHIVARNPDITGALVIGAQKFQAALLIEPDAAANPFTTAEQAALIEHVWPSVEEANQLAPAHARVDKSLIMITSADRPLIRAGKGTIQRTASLAQYATEIERLYASADLGLDEDPGHAPFDTTNPRAVLIFVRNSIRSVTGWSYVRDSDNFFERGMDSLQALQLTRTLKRGLYRPNLALPTIYNNPSVLQLMSAIKTEDGGTNENEMMTPLLNTYRELIHQITPPKLIHPNTEPQVDVILTGSTGALGTFMLQSLLTRPDIGHVFCLNRAKDGGRTAQDDRFAAAGFPTDGFSDRVTFLQADLAHPLLGLYEATYEELRTRVGLIIHNAWSVNFNLGLPAFRPQLAGLVNLFALAAASAPRTTRVVFISSVGVVGGRPADAGPAPEALLDTFDMHYSNGYARSKFLSEHLCDAAARHLGIPIAIARVGQVAGPVSQPGLWNRSEWLPSLVISSLHLGCLPEHLGPQFSEIDWVPSDMLADVVVDLASQSSQKRPGAGSGADVFNLRNPRTTTWEALVPAVAETAQARLGRTLEIVPPSVWLNRLQESIAAASEGDARDLTTAAAANPAIKLLEFYRDGLWANGGTTQLMAVERALASPTLQHMPAVGLDWTRKWVEEWISAQSRPNGLVVGRA
ncbi:putative NRPS-like enzyme [Biscogniauxia mediterranea]|nr:putative NRPS-like enzyme [Biscogniauxia mediterranea]